MLHICYEELERLKEDIKSSDFTVYVNTWDFEDDYSHNEIEENREKFIDLANAYFNENNLQYVARGLCENVIIRNKE